MEAIRTLEKIESENRTATPEEQEILSQYVGWGGLADAFDETKANWHNEYQELKGILSDAEYAGSFRHFMRNTRQLIIFTVKIFPYSP